MLLVDEQAFSFLGSSVFLRCFLASFDLFLTIHGAAASLGAAMADRLIVFVTIVEVVVVGEFFSRSDVAQGDDPDVFVKLVSLAVGIAAVIDERRDAIPVDDVFALADAEEIGVRPLGIELVGLFLGEARTGVLDDVGTLRDGHRRIATGAMDTGLADQQIGRIDRSHALLR